ncbi:hypothetical protein ACFW6F_10525 [Streptomyces sp. NPDC058746]|uniref:hypothetical protein n=1 Tax=Streptomyces sp. NPDC058746 TaxID=3346622 RepID=UPI003684533B
MKRKTWVLALAALVLAGAGIGAAGVVLEPGLAPTSSADVGHSANDDRELAGHCDELLWVRITGREEHERLFGGGPVRVGYTGQVQRVFKGRPPQTVVVNVVYSAEDTSRMTTGQLYVIAISRGHEPEERWMSAGSLSVETPSLDAPDTQQGEHNRDVRQPAPATQAERWTRAVTHQLNT